MTVYGRYGLKYEKEGIRMYVKTFKKSGRKIALSPQKKEAACYSSRFEAEDIGSQIDCIFKIGTEVFDAGLEEGRMGGKETATEKISFPGETNLC